MKENLQCTSKYGHLRISQDICHVRMTDIEGFLTIYGHSDNLLNNKREYLLANRIFMFFPPVIIISLSCLGYEHCVSHAQILLYNDDCYVTMQDTWQA